MSLTSLLSHWCSLPALIIFLAACQPAPPPAPTQTPFQLADLYTTAPTPTKTTTLPLSPSPNRTPTIEINNRLLDPGGPWIFSSHPDISNLYLMNLDGTGYTPLDIPSPESRIINLGYIAGSFFSKDYLIVPQGELPTRELWIMKLSSGNLIRKINLIGEQAQQAIDNFIRPTPPFLPLSPWPPISHSVGEFLWSPDGKYLAFVGAIEGPSGDIYLYHPETDHLTRLTSGPGQTKLLGWSPNSQTIVHKSGEEYDHHFNLRGEALWTVDIDGRIELISTDPKISFNPLIADWIDDHTYVSYTPLFESSPINLTLVDISSKELTPIDAPRFLDAQYDSRNHRILINWGSAMGLGVGGYGIYEYSLEDSELKEFASEVELFEVLTSMPYYILRHGSTSFLTDEDGDLLFELDCDYCDLSISPDNGHLILPIDGSVFLTDAHLNFITEIEHVDIIQWLPDSSGFFSYVGSSYPGDQIYFYSAANDWQPILVNYVSLYTPFFFVQP